MFYSIQVERVVISQLANAFEQGLLSPRNKVCLVVSYGKENQAAIKLKIDGNTEVSLSQEVDTNNVLGDFA